MSESTTQPQSTSDLGAQVVMLGQRVARIRGTAQTRGSYRFDMAAITGQIPITVWPIMPAATIVRRAGDSLVVEMGFGIRGHRTGEGANEPEKSGAVFEVLATFSITYDLNDETPETTQEALDAFGEINGRFNLTAYWREYAQSCFARAGLPPFEIPPFNAAKALATLRQYESEKAKARTES